MQRRRKERDGLNPRHATDGACERSVVDRVELPRTRAASGSAVVFRIQRPDVFRLPEMRTPRSSCIAGGSCIAPFRSFLQERARSARHTTSFCFVGTLAPTSFCTGDELDRAVVRGTLSLSVAFTRTVALSCVGTMADSRSYPRVRRLQDLMLAPAMAAHLWELAQAQVPRGQGRGVLRVRSQRVCRHRCWARSRHPFVIGWRARRRGRRHGE